ncbi:MAG TPA: hypothetical protein PKN33_19560 [Phycisphaerae bacterium]|nr:hypothetical protein [Phycisphaerae bacterium]
MFGRQWMCRAAVALCLLVTGVASADVLRVVEWNVSTYSSGRINEFQTAIYGSYQGRSMTPDVIIAQEFLSASGVTNFVNLLNSASGSPGDWAAAPFSDGPDTDNAFFFRTSKVALATELSATGMTIVATGGNDPNHPRDINRYDIKLVNDSADTFRMALYSSHMKASTGGTNQARRLLEAQRIRDDAQSLPAGWHFILGGDFNIRSSTEGAYVELVGSQSNNNGRFFDPIKTPGTWYNSSSFQIVHTQDPTGAGGMDDRFDQLLVSGGLVDGVGPDYIGNPNVAYSTSTWNDPNHSYRCWGNDGTTFNLAIKTTGNTMVGPTIAQALKDSALNGGHLPVFLDLRVPPCVADIDCDGSIDETDIAGLADCLDGPDVTPDASPTYLTAECLDAFDADDDGDVDLRDFDVFASVLAN